MNDSGFDSATGPIIRIERAVRKGSHVLISLYGFSGCGKTLSAIYLARGLVGPQGRICMIDTETDRGLIYSLEAGGYDRAELTPPFTPERYIEAIKTVEKAGYDALILDQASSEWEGIGGIVEMADAATDGQGKPLKGLVKWANPKARHKKFVQALIATRMHVIVCLRAKEKMIQVTRDNLAKYPGTKIGDIMSDGFISIQDKRFIYETTVQIFLPMPDGTKPRGVPVLEKCPKDLLGAFPEGEQIGIAAGERIRQWVAGGVPVDQAAVDLKRTAEEKATLGTESMRAWWLTLQPGQQKQLSPYLANLRSIAGTADEEAAHRAAEGTKKDAEEDEGRLKDPFGEPVGAPPVSTGAAPPFVQPMPPVASPAPPTAPPPPPPPAIEVKRLAVDEGEGGVRLWGQFCKAVVEHLSVKNDPPPTPQYVGAWLKAHAATLGYLKAESKVNFEKLMGIIGQQYPEIGNPDPAHDPFGGG